MKPCRACFAIGKPQRPADTAELVHGDLQHMAEEFVEVGFAGQKPQRLDQHFGLAVREFLREAPLGHFQFERLLFLLQAPGLLFRLTQALPLLVEFPSQRLNRAIRGLFAERLVVGFLRAWVQRVAHGR